MVFYFYPRCHVPNTEDFMIYMGKDKYENEDLIAHGLPCDLWFHVDDMSSAHVYLRLPDGCDMRDIPAEALEDCAQLVKQNSIQGCKTNNVVIVYTPWSNLKKTAGMEVGQVGFHDPSLVLKVKVERKNNEIINRLEKTRQERYPDLAAEKEVYMSQVRQQRRAEERAARAEQKAAKEERRKQEDMKSYKHIMKDEFMVSNKELKEKYASVEEMEEDFM
ncbi:hypothetical protein HYH02_008729 [Chlamydomonas schloesseri]|uniref:NFACT RNA-binding domain-containing protein n=1 Tax=Chlamydomonas schloesseri TaxID=2026947 RepID=A0A835WDG4_9CHLO|nr:hypothetical protein HYH02_008729 [Chlamydomonas schloesseri]|eukprot:KAG2445261.1 hypothetical protein HYH02_008729 [Chlamydomonas schloesseri]